MHPGHRSASSFAMPPRERRKCGTSAAARRFASRFLLLPLAPIWVLPQWAISAKSRVKGCGAAQKLTHLRAREWPTQPRGRRRGRPPILVGDGGLRAIGLYFSLLHLGAFRRSSSPGPQLVDCPSDYFSDAVADLGWRPAAGSRRAIASRAELPADVAPRLQSPAARQFSGRISVSRA